MYVIVVSDGVHVLFLVVLINPLQESQSCTNASNLRRDTYSHGFLTLHPQLLNSKKADRPPIQHIASLTAIQLMDCVSCNVT